MDTETRALATGRKRGWITVVALMAAAMGPGAGMPVAATTPPCLRPPVAGVVVDPFRAPPCRWCAGNRGIEFGVDPDARVVNAATGRVEFAGVVAGTVYVVVRLPNGWRLTYGELTEVLVRGGEPVLAGRLLGRAAGIFHFGLRIGDDYADPAPYIGRVTGRPRLVPVDGSAARAVPSHEVRCRVSTTSR
jgi:murein DD-endopeptidase MepM/ murein hydrolase activator NlpD